MMLVHIVLMHEVTAGNLVKLNGCIALTNSSITSGLYKKENLHFRKVNYVQAYVT